MRFNLNYCLPLGYNVKCYVNYEKFLLAGDWRNFKIINKCYYRKKKGPLIFRF